MNQDDLKYYDRRYINATQTANGARNYLLKMVANGANPANAPASILKRAGGYATERSGQQQRPAWNRQLPDGTPLPDGVEF